MNEQEKVKQKIDGFLKKYTDKKVFSQHFKPEEKHEIGDVWTDEDGIEWKQEEGYKIRNSNAVMNKLKDEVCSKCKKYISSRIDKKMMIYHKMCMDCVAEMETQLRIEGKWEEYEKTKIKENIRSYIKDTEQQTKEFCEQIDNGLTIVNVANESLKSIDYEKWHQSKEDAEAQKQFALNILEAMYKDFEKSFGEKVHDK